MLPKTLILPRTLILLLGLTGLAGASSLIVDGDFSSPAGPSTFSTGYSNITCGGGTEPGQYAIATNPNTCNSAFASFGDPARDGGNILVLDGNSSGTPYDGSTGALAGVAWEETIAVSSGTLYTFSAEVASNDTSNLAELQLYVNGTAVGSAFDAPGTAGSWSPWTQGFTPTSGSITLSIQDVNSNPTGYGNDFSLDDLCLIAPGTSCTSSTSAVPEPSSVTVCFLGLVGMGVCGALRRKSGARS
jgi:hypothetical protein